MPTVATRSPCTWSHPCALDETRAATRQLPPIRQRLERLARDLRTAPDETLAQLPPEKTSSLGTPAKAAAALDAYLARGLPPQSLTWTVRCDNVSSPSPPPLPPSPPSSSRTAARLAAGSCRFTGHVQFPEGGRWPVPRVALRSHSQDGGGAWQ